MTVTWQDVPDEYKEQVEELRERIVEAACDFDADLEEKYLNGEKASLEQIKAALRKGVIDLKITPTFCGSAFKNKGVQLVLDAVIDYLPSPLDIPPMEGHVVGTDEIVNIPADPAGPFYALVFKIKTDQYVGVLNFIR